MTRRNPIAVLAGIAAVAAAMALVVREAQPSSPPAPPPPRACQPKAREIIAEHLILTWPDETTVAATWAETQARVNAKLAADAEEGRDGWAEIDAKAEARRAARAVRLAEKP